MATGITIIPAENPLSSYSSYSYTFSFFMISHKQYDQLREQKVRTTKGYHLLMQSGGIGPDDSKGLSRNPYFQDDFFIDDVEVKNLITGKATGAGHSAHELNFTVTEPYGITFLDRLKKASADLAKSSPETPSAFSTGLGQPYLFVIRFYGYDANGKLVKGNSSLFSDSTAIDEKFLPFFMSEIKFRIANGLVEYQCKGVPVWHQIALGSTTGTLPIAVEVSAATVGELLSGTGQSSAKSVTRSLADSINSYHKSNATNGGIPNQVIFEFTDPAIEKAVLKKDGPTNLQATPATLAQGPADKLLDSKQSVKSTERNFSFAAGTPIIQVIDQVIRASSYITDQQNTKIDETGQVIPNPAADKPMKWFVTNGQVELKTDSNGNTAHTLTYRISPFQVNLDLPGFPPPQFRGTHKRYDYWFTGQNKEVLQFEQEHNYTYYQQTASQLGSSQIQLRTSAREQEEKVRKVAQVGSSASTQGAVAGANDIAATAAASLYSLADQAMCKIVIMGDPHWIGEYDRASAGQPPVIDYESQEILIEINFNIPSDYNLNTGLMEVNKTNYNRNSTTRTAGDPTFSFVYMATNISSTFKDGKFTQQIDGILKIFYDKVDNAAGKPATGVSGGEQPAGRAIKGGTADMFTKNKFGQSPPTIVSDITSQSLLLKVPSPTDSAFGMVGGDPLKFALPDTAPEVVKLRSGTTVEVRSVAELNQLRAQLQIDNKEYVRLRKELEN